MQGETALMRSGEDLKPMPEDQLRKIFTEGKPDFLAGIALDDLSSDDVVRLLDTPSYFDLLNFPYPAAREAVLDRFERERLICKHDGFYGITNLGAILFAKRLDEFPTVWRKAPRVIVFEGMGKLATKLDRPETKGYAVGFAGLIDLIFSRSEERPRLANRSVAGVDFQDRALQSPGGAGIVSSPRLMVMKRSDEP
jgi:ATP-dependent DNA helicase RecG